MDTVISARPGPDYLGLTMGPDYNEPCSTRFFNRRSAQASHFLEDFRLDV
jgi:hypothetical protein